VALNYVLDTNVVIYAQKGVLAEPLPTGHYFVSIITEIELLSFSDLADEQERALLELLNDVSVVGIDEETKRRAIDLRRRLRLRLPDAIIAATAMTLDADLLTNDTALAQVPALRSHPVALKST
jgi:predicted nucleic acid-binding protein